MSTISVEYRLGRLEEGQNRTILAFTPGELEHLPRVGDQVSIPDHGLLTVFAVTHFHDLNGVPVVVAVYMRRHVQK